MTQDPDGGSKTRVYGASVLRFIGAAVGLGGCAALICLVYLAVADDERFKERLTDCRLRMRNGDFLGARQELLKLHDEDPSHLEVLDSLATIEIATGNFAQAIEWLRRIPESDPERAAIARHRAAQMAMQLGRLEAVEELAQEAARLSPRGAEPRRLLLRTHFILRQDRQIAEQSALLDAQGQLSLVDLLMRCIGSRASWDDDEHVIWLERCLRQDRGNAAVRAALAHYYASRDRNEQAWRTLNEASADAPDAWRIALAQAELQIHEGRFKQAWESLSRLPSQADGESRAWLARGKVWAETGHEQAALVAFENAARLDPYDPTPSYAISRILTMRNDLKRARRHYERSQRLKELMGILSRLMEASNPAYHPTEPVEVTMRSAQKAFQQLGFAREAAIVASTERADAPTLLARTKPLSVPSVAALAKLDRAPRRPLSASQVPKTHPATQAARRVQFTDIAAKINLTFQYDTGRSPYRWLMETLGGGVAVIDYDLDGWDDLHFTQAGPLPLDPQGSGAADRLFRNVLGQAAEDVSELAGLSDNAYGQGSAVGDYDNDGFPDLVVCNYGELLIFRNQGDGTFQSAGAATGISSSKWSVSAAFFDIDRDGDLDLYVAHYLDAELEGLKPCKFQGAYTSCRPFEYEGVQDTLWENLGDGQFADRTADWGLVAPYGKGLGVVAVDFEGQGRESIFVANDTTANFLFQPQPGAKGKPYRESGGLAGVAVNGEGLTEACMGIAVGDVDGDGRFDLFVTNFQGETNTLYRCLGDGMFVDDTQRAGLADSSRDRLGFGCQFLDVDCNGVLDLFVANGLLHEIPQLPQLYYNSGAGRFQEISRDAGEYFFQRRLGRSVARLDWNRDMATDLAVAYQEGNVSLLQNQSDVGNRVVLRLVGVDSNRDAAGAIIRARLGDRVLCFQVTRSGGYFAANDPKTLIGCGSSATIDHLEVTWPSGKAASWQRVPVGRSYVLIENNDALLSPAN